MLAVSVQSSGCQPASSQNATLPIASPAASWMTGVILPVDGGATGAARVEVLPDE